MSDNQTRRDLEAIIRRVMEREDLPLSDQTTAADVPGWDSFKMLEILMEIQSRFDITLETQDIDHVRNIRDLQTRVDDKLRAKRK